VGAVHPAVRHPAEYDVQNKKERCQRRCKCERDALGGREWPGGRIAGDGDCAAQFWYQQRQH